MIRLTLCFLVLAANTPVDLTATFIRNGAVIENLEVFEISDIVLLRGRTNDRTRAEDAGRIAARLGHKRVANLIVIVDDATADAAITYVGRRLLQLEPSLAGCHFAVHSVQGAVELTGRGCGEEQGHRAVELLSRIDGVKSVSHAGRR